MSLLNYESYFYTSFLIQEPFPFRFFSISFLKRFDELATIQPSYFNVSFLTQEITSSSRSPSLLFPKWHKPKLSPRFAVIHPIKWGRGGPMGSRGSVSECFRGCTRESAIFGRERGTTNSGGSIQGRWKQKMAGKLSTVCTVNVDEAFSLTRLWNIDIFGPWPSCAFHATRKCGRKIKGWIKD